LSKLKEASVKATRLIVKNILGLESVEIKLDPKFTKIRGRNQTGKTSVIEALKSVLGGGVHDGTLLRTGADEGQIVLELGNGVDLMKKIKSDSSDFDAVHPETGKMSRAVTYLNNLRDKFSTNPIEFLTADSKKRIDLLLKTIPMKVTPKNLGFVPFEFVEQANFDNHAIQIIESIRSSMFDRRKDINSSVRDKNGTIETLSRAKPPESPEGVSWTETKEAYEMKIKGLNAETKQKIEKLESDYNTLKDSIDQKFETAAAVLQKKYEEDLQALRNTREAERDNASSVLMNDKNEITEVYKERFGKLKEKLTTAEVQAEAEIRFDETQKSIEKITGERDKLEEKSAELTEALGELQKLKNKLLKDIPVEGLEIKNDEILVNGIPFDRVNEAERVKLSVRLMSLRAGKLRIVVYDGLEALDESTQELLLKEADEQDLQVVGSFVTEDDHLLFD